VLADSLRFQKPTNAKPENVSSNIMNWIKKIFSKKEEDNSSNTSSKIQEKPTYKLFKSFNKILFYGIDKDFIDLIYFKDASEKGFHIKKIESYISSLGINTSTDIVTAKKLITESEESECFYFLFESLLFADTKMTEEENGTTSIVKQELIQKGIEKVTHYYSALAFGCFNITRKLEKNELDWTTEINLINNGLNSSNLFNYARMDALTFLTITYDKINQEELSSYYFTKIKEDKYDLAPSTITEFYSLIAEHYKLCSKFDKVIECYEAGLKINPKYGIKRELDKLKKEKSNTD